MMFYIKRKKNSHKKNMKEKNVNDQEKKKDANNNSLD